MIIYKKITLLEHPVNPKLWDLTKTYWRNLYLNPNSDITPFFELYTDHLRCLFSALSSGNLSDPFLYSLCLYFPDPSKVIKTIKRLKAKEDFSLETIHLLFIEVLRSQRKIYINLRPSQSAFILHRFLIFKIKDYIRSKMRRSLSEDALRSILYEKEYDLPVDPLLLPTEPLTELYCNHTEIELSGLLLVSPTEAGRRKRNHLLKLKNSLKGL